MIKIACVGDNVVDINYIDGLINPGGNCVNVAVYCSQLGFDAAYVGVMADDGYGKIVADSMVKNGVDISHCVYMHGETGRCSCKLIDGDRVLGDENGGGLVKSDPLVITDDLVEYLKGFDIVHTSCYSYIEDQMIKVKNAGVPVLYDFSTEWADEKKVARVAEFADYVLFSGRSSLSDEENLRMFKDAVDKYGYKLSIMTMGTKGAWVYDGKKVFTKAPYNIEGGAIDTTGCGDSWISGFITSYMDNKLRLDRMTETASGSFIVGENYEDAMANAIEISMCMGNLRARYTSQIKGAYGCGFPVAEYKD